jgi:hypothetical protein
MPFFGGPAFDAAEPRPIEGFILFRCRAIFHAKQATQSYPKAISRKRMPRPRADLADRPNDDEAAYSILTKRSF